MISQIAARPLSEAGPTPANGQKPLPRVAPAAQHPLRVLLLTEGSYPYHFGGVSTWCHTLVESLPEVRFSLMAVVADPRLEPRFALPANVEKFIPVSIWGTYDLLETRRDLSYPTLLRRRQATTEEVIRESFIPAFRSFLEHLFSDATSASELAQVIVQMHRFFVAHDFDAALRSSSAWITFSEIVREHAPGLARRAGLEGCDYGLWQLTRAMQCVYRWLFPLARQLPPVDLVHAAMAGLCTMVAVTAKLQHGAGYLLTEHGIYLRESYLAAVRSRDGWLIKLLGISFARRMTELSYAWADMIRPVCDYNHRWELRIGAAPERLQTIYYGVDPGRFQPVANDSTEPVVAWVGRIDPLKDIHTLLRAAAIVHRVRQDVRFKLYGAPEPATEDYYRGCLAFRHELELDEVVSFAGFVKEPAAAFNASDIVVMSSISEATPYSILEAMLCGKPVIATGVGGIPELLADAGLVVEPRNPEQLAMAIIHLVGEPTLRAEMGRAARENAMDRFGIPQFASNHLQAYQQVANLRGLGPYPVSQPSPNGLASKAVRQSDVSAAAAMVREVAASPPVDSLEVAALLESMGTTDQVASVRYGAANVFELAAAVLKRLHEREPRQVWDPEPDKPRTGRLQQMRELARGPLGFLQLALLVSIIFAAGQFYGWNGDRIFALALGMSTGILLVSALIIGLGRRPTVYLGLGDYASARAALALSTAAAIVVAALFAFVVGGLLWRFSTVTSVWTFLAGYAVFSVIWIAALAAITARASEWLVLGLAVGVGVGVAVYLSLGRSVLLLGTAAGAGFTAAVAVAAAGGWLSLRSTADRKGGRTILPTRGYMLHEAGPYLTFALLYMVLFVLPHVLSWAGRTPPGLSRLVAIETLEHGLTLGLLPLMISFGLIEQASLSFWRHASAAQRAIAGSKPGDFGRNVLRSLYVPQLGRLLAVLGLASAGTWALVESRVTRGWLSLWLLPPDRPEAQLWFAAALLAYGLLGWGLFNCAYTLSLARPGLALRDMLPAVAVTLALGLPFSFGLGFGYAVIGFAAGTLTLVFASSRTTWNLLRTADYHYYSSTT